MARGAEVCSAGERAVTLDDVAREVGVSPSTVSRVLNGSRRGATGAVPRRVKEAAARLGYSVNVSARAVARGTSDLVAVLVADVADPYFARIIAGVSRGADEAGLTVTIATTGRDLGREATLLRELRGQRPRGVILAASRSAGPVPSAVEAEAEAIGRLGGRVVALGPGADGLRSVLVDNRGGAAALARALAGLGYRRAVALAAPVGLLTSDLRVDSFAASFAEAGGSVETVYRTELTREGGVAAMEVALADGVAAGTVVFAVTDAVALGALRALRAAGRVVGADVAVAGFDDVAETRDVTPFMTSVCVPVEEMGLQSLRAAIDDEWVPAPLPLTVHLRDSTPRVY